MEAFEGGNIQGNEGVNIHGIEGANNYGNEGANIRGRVMFPVCSMFENFWDDKVFVETKAYTIPVLYLREMSV